MLLERLTAYYGIGGVEETNFINSRIDSYSEAAQERLFEAITADCSKRFGFPDLQKLYRFFNEIAPDGKKEGPKVWFWRKCRKCGCEFWSDLMYCPSCYRQGIKNLEADIKTSSNRPGPEVIRFNKPGPYSDGNYKACADCEKRMGSFCYWFGVETYDCLKRSDCPCNECCMRAMKNK